MKKLTKEQFDEIKGKYIFHGSPKLFDVCNPNQAECASGNIENTKFAIYGSSNLEFAILFAFDKFPNSKNKNCGWSATVNNGSAVGALYRMQIDANAKGYLYCFDKKNFAPTAEGSIQEVSFKSQNPAAVFEVDYKDFAHLFKLLKQDFEKGN